jgi:hypothetical protein
MTHFILASNLETKVFLAQKKKINKLKREKKKVSKNVQKIKNLHVSCKNRENSVACSNSNNDDENYQNDETNQGQQQLLPPRLILEQGALRHNNKIRTWSRR